MKTTLLICAALLAATQASANENTVSGLISVGYEIKAMTRNSSKGYLILQKTDKAKICEIDIYTGKTKKCKEIQ